LQELGKLQFAQSYVIPAVSMNKNRQNATLQKEVVDAERRLSQQLARVGIHVYFIITNLMVTTMMYNNDYCCCMLGGA
jgi:hypothetical protein